MTWALGAFIITIGLMVYGKIMFHVGYSTGWSDRQKAMTLPPKRLVETNRRIDDDHRYDRHTAIGPIKHHPSID